MKVWNVSYEYVVADDATVGAETKQEAKDKVLEVVGKVKITGVWEVKDVKRD